MISTGTTEDKYILRASSLPFLVEEDGKSYVTGEIYEVTSKTLSNLDLLEGHPDWYKRKVITVIDELGDKYKAWAYFVTMSETIGCETVESGDYREYLSEMSEVTM
jgi:gamma-glutamylaminecyclotransferase